jgi:predicted signal transduction protein with EAL and GGDEF domain
VFIPLAEERGFIDSLTETLLKKAAETAKHWPVGVFLSFNLSSAQLIDPATAFNVLAIINRVGLDPRRLELEITETAMMSDPEVAAKVVNELHTIGIRVSLDDFGTGQSSLGRLRDFAFNKVKIDRSFISEITVDKSAEHIVRAILMMCEGLNLKVIAEGIETEEQALNAPGNLAASPGRAGSTARPSIPPTTFRHDRSQQEFARVWRRTPTSSPADLAAFVASASRAPASVCDVRAVPLARSHEMPPR